MPLSKFGTELNNRRQKGFASEFRIRQMIEWIINTKNFLSMNQNNEYDVDLKRIVNVQDPVSDGDGVNKKYVDKMVSLKSSSSHHLNLDLKHNRLQNVGKAVQDSDAVNKKLMDETINKDFLKCLSFNKEGNYNAQSKKIVNVGYPYSEGDATNKKYVDLKLAEANQNTKNGLIKIVSDTIKTSSVECKQYIDQIFKKNVDFHKNRIMNIAAPHDPNDAATKKYVDDKILPIPNLSKFLTLNEQGNYDIKMKKITNVNAPSSEGDVANKRYVDHMFNEASHYVKSDMQRILSEELERASRENRHYIDSIIASPSASNVTKKYVDDKISANFSILELKLEALPTDQIYSILPWNEQTYRFPVNVLVKVNKYTGNINDLFIENFNELLRERLNDDISESLIDNGFRLITVGSYLRFVKKTWSHPAMDSALWTKQVVENQCIQFLIRPE